MKRKFLIMIFVLSTLAILFYLQFGREPVVNHSTIMKHSETYDLSLVVTLNQLVVLNQKKVQHMLVQKIQNNDFKDIQFSYDLHGRPQNIYVKVYVNGLTYQFDFPAFEFMQIEKQSSRTVFLN